MNNAKVFWSGRSQAVRLPKDFRFDTEEVRIRKHGNSVILEPVIQDWSWLDNLQELDADMIATQQEEIGQQQRPELDKLFP